MTTTGLNTFDHTVQITNEWLNDITGHLGYGDNQLAYHALRSTLHALRDRIPVHEAIEFGSQLPMLVRGFYYEGWDPNDNPSKERTIDAFLTHIARDYDYQDDKNLAELARAVFLTINDQVTPGQTAKVRDMLNENLRGLWPEPAVAV